MFLETFRARSFWGTVSGRNSSPIALIGVVAPLLVSFGVPDSARADNCLTAPNSSAPQGSHWYYRTDRANQRKCWYFRASGEPAQQATAQATSEAAPAAQAHGTLSTPPAGAPMSISPSDVAPPSPHAKMLAVEAKRVPSVSTTNDKLVQGGAQEGSTATSDQPASNLPGAWPESPPAVGTVQTQESIAVPTDARADSADIKADTLASNDAESTAGSGEPTTNVGMAGSPQVFLIIALGLAVVGILSRIVMTIAARRRARVVFNYPKSDPVEDRGPDEWRDAQDEYGSFHGREADYPPVSTASDYGPPRLFQTDSACPNSPRDLNEVSKRDDTLAQLRQELDRLLQSERARQRLPTRDDEQNTIARSFRASGQTQGEALRKALGLV